MKRITFLDSLKGLTIFFVLWGHSIQNLRDEDDFLNNALFEFIYSFHMPLFFIISGFFFKTSLRKSFKDFTLNKVIQLLLPCISWTLIFAFLYQITLDSDINWTAILNRVINPKEWYYWFLRDLFFSYFLMYVSYKIFKNETLAILFSIIFVLIIPDSFRMQRTFLPFFIIGILLKGNFNWILKKKNVLLCLTGLMFIVSIYFWKGIYTIYRTDFPSIINWQTLSINLSNIDISFFRLCIGAFGGLFFFLLIEKIENQGVFFKKLQSIGKQSLGIYILQLPFLEVFANKYLDFSNINLIMYNFVITPLISFLTLLVCLLIIQIIKKNKVLDLILLGNNSILTGN